MKKIFALIIVLVMSVNCAGVVFAVESEDISAFLYELNAVTKTDEFINVINENIWSVSDLEQYAYYVDNSKIQYATSQLFLQNGTGFNNIVDFKYRFEINVLLARANNVSVYSEMSEIIYQFAPYIDIGEYNSLTSSEQTDVCNMMSSSGGFYSAEQFRTRLLSCIDEIAHSSSTVYPGGGGSPIDAQIDACTFGDNAIDATITFNKNTSDSIMYVAVYHKSNYLKHLKKYSLSSGTMSIGIEILGYTHNDGDVLKVFFLDTSDGITPMGYSLCYELQKSILTGRISGTYLLGDTTDYGSVNFTYYDCVGDAHWQKLLSDSVEAVTTLKCDIPNINDYYGIDVQICVVSLGNNQYKLAEMAPTQQSRVLNLELRNIDSCTDTEISYYTSDAMTDTSSVGISSTAEKYWNYQAVSTLDNLKFNIGSSYEIIVKLIENTGDNLYDIVEMRNYCYDRVSTVDTSENLLSGRFSYFELSGDAPATIMNEDGTQAELADFSEDDVIAYISSNGNSSGFDWVEIINLGANCVSGIVEGRKVNSVFINGKEYYLAGVPVYLGDTAVFYLTKTDMIFDFAKTDFDLSQS